MELHGRDPAARGRKRLEGLPVYLCNEQRRGQSGFAVGSDSQVKAMEFQGTSTNTVTELTWTRCRVK